VVLVFGSSLSSLPVPDPGRCLFQVEFVVEVADDLLLVFVVGDHDDLVRSCAVDRTLASGLGPRHLLVCVSYCWALAYGVVERNDFLCDGSNVVQCGEPKRLLGLAVSRRVSQAAFLAAAHALAST
jgi:hypothetical protein